MCHWCQKTNDDLWICCEEDEWNQLFVVIARGCVRIVGLLYGTVMLNNKISDFKETIYSNWSLDSFWLLKKVSHIPNFKVIGFSAKWPNLTGIIFNAFGASLILLLRTTYCVDAGIQSLLLGHDQTNMLKFTLVTELTEVTEPDIMPIHSYNSSWNKTFNEAYSCAEQSKDVPIFITTTVLYYALPLCVIGAGITIYLIFKRNKNSIHNNNGSATHFNESTKSFINSKLISLIETFAESNRDLVTVFTHDTQSNQTHKPSKQNVNSNNHTNKRNKNNNSKNANNNNNKSSNNNNGGSDDEKKKDDEKKAFSIDSDSDEDEEDDKEMDKFFELLANEPNLNDDELCDQLSKFSHLETVYKKVSKAVNKVNQAMNRISTQSSFTCHIVPSPKHPLVSVNGYSSKSENSPQLSSENESTPDRCKKHWKKKKRKKRKKRQTLPKTKYKYDFQNPLSSDIEHEQNVKECILNKKWYNAQAIQSAEIHGETHENGRLTFSLEASEFMRRCEKVVTQLKNQSESIVLTPINMIDSNNNSGIQYLFVMQIDAAQRINIGISFKFVQSKKGCNVVVTGFHLNLKLFGIECDSCDLRVGYLNIYAQTEQYYETRFKKLLPFIQDFIVCDENEIILMEWKKKAQLLWTETMGSSIQL